MQMPRLDQDGRWLMIDVKDFDRVDDCLLYSQVNFASADYRNHPSPRYLPLRHKPKQSGSPKSQVLLQHDRDQNIRLGSPIEATKHFRSDHILNTICAFHSARGVT